MEQNEISKSNKIKIIVITALIFLVSIAGISYAYFTIQITGNEEASSMILRTANMSLVYNDVQIVSGEYATPGWSDTKTLTVTNNGNVTSDYIIKFRELVNTVINGELVLSAECSASSGSCSDLPERAVHSASTEITDAYMYGPISIAPGITHTYTLTVEFIETGSNQNYNQNKYFNGTLNIGDGTATDESCFTTSGSTALSITSYTCSDTDVIIPRTINGRTVTSIGVNSFKDKGITSIVMPETITSLGYRCFYQCSLTSVVLPSGITSIGNESFKGNSLTSVVIPNTVTSIATSAFSSNQLVSAVIPNGITSLENNVFSVNNLTYVVLPNSITTIGAETFFQNQLSSVIIPNSVTSMGVRSFSKNQLTSVILGNSVDSIGVTAFYENNITQVRIPASVTSIENTAFGSNQLISVIIEGKSSSNQFTTYGNTIWGWASQANRTCTVTNNTSNVEGGCIYWAGSGS